MKPLLLLMMGAFFPFAQDLPEVRISSTAWFPPNLTISADTNLVQLTATVTDRHGRAVTGLKASDFEVLDNQQPREIRFFEERRSGGGQDGGSAVTGNSEPVSERRSLALFFDDAHDGLQGLRKSADAAETLIRNHLHPEDRVGVFTASGFDTVDFTQDRDALVAALHRLILRPLSAATPESKCPSLNAWKAYAIAKHVDPDVELTAIEEAAVCNCPKPVAIACRRDQRVTVQTAADMVWAMSQPRSTVTLDAIGIVMKHLATQPNARVLVLMTPGFPAEKGMESRVSALLDTALRGQIRVTGMQVLGKGVPLSIARREFIGQAAKATGGVFVDGYADPDATLRQLVTAPTDLYALGFTPSASDGTTHILKTRVAPGRGYTVEARTEYFAAKPAGETAQQRIDRVALSHDVLQGFPASLQVQQERDAIHVTIAVDARGLRFPTQEGRRVQELTLLTILEDEHGNFLAGKEAIMSLAFTAATLTDKERKGIEAATSFSARPGVYRVREIAREATQNRVWVGTAAVEVR